MRAAKIIVIAALLWLFGCCSKNWQETSPWNFPPAKEWNEGLEFSWVNAVDKFRVLTAPRGKVYDPVMRSYAPDFGKALRDLKKSDASDS